MYLPGGVQPRWRADGKELYYISAEQTHGGAAHRENQSGRWPTIGAIQTVTRVRSGRFPHPRSIEQCHGHVTRLAPDHARKVIISGDELDATCNRADARGYEVESR